jgi:hypothetical protein
MRKIHYFIAKFSPVCMKMIIYAVFSTVILRVVAASLLFRNRFVFVGTDPAGACCGITTILLRFHHINDTMQYEQHYAESLHCQSIIGGFGKFSQLCGH